MVLFLILSRISYDCYDSSYDYKKRCALELCEYGTWIFFLKACDFVDFIFRLFLNKSYVITFPAGEKRQIFHVCRNGDHFLVTCTENLNLPVSRHM